MSHPTQRRKRPYIYTRWGLSNLFFLIAGIGLMVWPIADMASNGTQELPYQVIAFLVGLILVFTTSVNFRFNRGSKP